MSVTHAFTCTGPYAVLILTGLKRLENRSMWPLPSEGRCAVTVSKRFSAAEHANFLAWAARALPAEIVRRLPSWEAVKGWPGHVVATIGYRSQYEKDCMPEDLAERRMWDEGYACWWALSAPRLLPEPIPCRGNVGFWRLPPDLAAEIAAADGERGL